jgi:hypothetical protein
MRQHFPEESLKSTLYNCTGQLQILTIQKYEKKQLFSMGTEGSRITKSIKNYETNCLLNPNFCN